MKENRVTYFELPCEDPKKTMSFFEQVFNWSFEKFGDQEYWFAKTGEQSPGIDGAIMKKRNPLQPMTNSISVKNIDEALEKVGQHGGQVVVEKMPISESGWLAFFKDPDGNIHGLWQDDSAASQTAG